MHLHELEPLVSENEINVVVEVPKGNGSKFKYDLKTGFFRLHRVLPRGLLFPYDYGFVPSTMGEDDDPLDVLIFVDTALFCGCIASGQLVGVIRGPQKGNTDRSRVTNDILLAVNTESASWKGVSDIDAIPGPLLDEIELFFTTYRNFQGKDFRVRKREGSRGAKKLLQRGMARFEQWKSP